MRKSKKMRLFNLLFHLVLITLFLTTSSFAQDDSPYKLMMGYQCWFLCEGDSSATNRWIHWFNSGVDPSASQIGIDYWPAMDEYKDTWIYCKTFFCLRFKHDQSAFQMDERVQYPWNLFTKIFKSGCY